MMRKSASFFPECEGEQAAQAKAMQGRAARALALGKAMGAMKGRGTETGDVTQTVVALRGLYQTPWEAALQKWVESIAAGERTYFRPSRREIPGNEIVLAGRKRESKMLNVVLDTSGSMSDAIPPVLGAIADFCRQLSVDEIRLMQCDAAVTGDEIVSPEALSAYEISGYGGSDLSPAMRALAQDERVTAALVITDGDIAYPPHAMPYDVLWVVTLGASGNFTPAYGRTIRMEGARS
jgi:predicted metal-dependent peptidase